MKTDNPSVLLDLLCCLIPERDIADIHYLDKEMPGFVFSDKKHTFDIYCEASSGEQFVVEVLEEGLVSRYSLRDDRCGELLTDNLHFVFLELGRLKYGKDELDRCSTLLEKLAYALRYIGDLDGRPEELKEHIFRRLFEVAEIGSMSVEQRKIYDKAMYTNLDRIIDLNNARFEGREEGMKEGLAKGKEQASLQMAKRLLSGHILPPDKVAEVTGLSEQELDALL